MKKSSLRINLTYRLIHQFIILVIPLIITPYVSRILGVEGIGIYSYYYSLVLYFSYFAMIGISTYGNRSIAKIKDDKDKVNKTFSSIYFLQLMSSIIVIIIYAFFIFFSNNKTISSIMILYLFAVLFDINWLYFGLEKVKIPIAVQVLSRITTLILIFLMIKTKKDLLIYVLLKSLSDCIANLFIWLFSLKIIKFKKINLKEIKKHIKPCIILFIPVIASSIYQHMDKVMLGLIVNKTEVGYYESATKLVVISLGIITAILSVISPKLSYLHGTKKDNSFNKLFKISLIIIMCIGIALSFGINAISTEFVPLFFGNDYIKSINITKIISISIIFISWSNTFRWLYFIPKNKDTIYVKSVILGAVINVISNSILIPFFNSYGAAIGTVLAEFTVALYQTIKVKNEIKIKFYFKSCIVYIFFAVIMYFLIINIKFYNINSIFNIILKIIIGTLIYAIFVFIYYKKIKLLDKR